MTKKLLIIEDNQSLVANLFAYLEPKDYSLDTARDGMAGLHLALNEPYDAIILDWMLPRISGKECVRRMRAAGSTVPVLMLTARDELDDKIAGFKAGADDYLTKPFAFAELEVRIEALILRTQRRSRLLQVGDLQYNLATQEISRAGVPLQLYLGCKRLLEVLMKNSPEVVPRRELEAALWGDDPPERDMLRSHIYELRKRVDGKFPQKLIQTVPKLGYRILDSGTATHDA